MRTKFMLISLMSISVLFFSCKDGEAKKSEKQSETTVKKENPKTFKVILNVIAKKDDSFHLFYSEDGTLNFPEETSIWVNFKGSETPQNIVFELPEDIIPSLLRIDLNSYQQEESIQINGFKMKYYSSEFNVDGKGFFDYFGPNLETVEIVDKNKGIIKPLVKEGQKYSPPSFYPSEEALKTRIDQVVKGTQK
jgi:hypothetical protein